MKDEISIIVADNEVQTVAEVCTQLEALGRRWQHPVHCHKAFSGSEILDLLVELRGAVDALFLDFDFRGGMNGEEILHEIEDPFEQIFVVLMSGREPSILEEVIRRGFQGRGERFFFLAKPISTLMLQHAFDRGTKYLESRPLPFLLAHPYLRITQPDSPLALLTAIKDFFEATLIYCCIVLLSEARLRVPSNSALPIGDMHNLTMGGWLKVVNDLQVTAGRHRTHFVPELKTFLGGRRGEAQPLQLIRDFKEELRDPIVGHGITLDESVYEGLAAPYRQRASSMARAISFAARYPIFVVDDSDYEQSAERYRFTSRLVMGTQYPYAKVTWHSEFPHQRRRLYLWRRDGRTMLLHPFMRMESCPNCRKDQVFFPTQLTSRQIRYQAVCNHRLSLSWE